MNINPETMPNPTVSPPWECDACREPIETVEGGWVEWLQNSPDESTRREWGLRLVHHKEGCMYNQQQIHRDQRALAKDMPLEHYVGTDGLVRLLEFLAEGKVPAGEVLELINRLHIPNFERARPFMKQALLDGVVTPDVEGFYLQDELKRATSHGEGNVAPITLL